MGLLEGHVLWGIEDDGRELKFTGMKSNHLSLRNYEMNFMLKQTHTKVKKNKKKKYKMEMKCFGLSSSGVFLWGGGRMSEDIFRHCNVSAERHLSTMLSLFFSVGKCLPTLLSLVYMLLYLLVPSFSILFWFKTSENSCYLANEFIQGIVLVARNGSSDAICHGLF